MPLPLERAVLALIPDKGTITESKLLHLAMVETRASAEEVKAAVSELHYRNEIRWVAFSGWAKGGRPS